MTRQLDSYTISQAKHETDMKLGSAELRDKILDALIAIKKRDTAAKVNKALARRAQKLSSVKTLPSSAPLGDSLGANR